MLLGVPLAFAVGGVGGMGPEAGVLAASGGLTGVGGAGGVTARPASGCGVSPGLCMTAGTGLGGTGVAATTG